MKKYKQPARKLAAALVAVCLLMVTVGILLISFAPQHSDFYFVFLGIGAPLGLIFFIILCICSRSYLLVGEDRIVFPYTRQPKFRLKRYSLAYSDIKYIKVIFYDGIGINIKDSLMYKFVLNNGDSFTEAFFSYGRQPEQEIVELLKRKVRFIH